MLAIIIIGATLMQVVTKADLFVSVRNPSQLTVPLRGQRSFNLTPRSTTLRQTLQVQFAGGWDADDGDILDVTAAFEVHAGVHVDHSHAHGPRLAVVTYQVVDWRLSENTPALPPRTLGAVIDEEELQWRTTGSAGAPRS